MVLLTPMFFSLSPLTLPAEGGNVVVVCVENNRSKGHTPICFLFTLSLPPLLPAPLLLCRPIVLNPPPLLCVHALDGYKYIKEDTHTQSLFLLQSNHLSRSPLYFLGTFPLLFLYFLILLGLLSLTTLAPTKNSMASAPSALYSPTGILVENPTADAYSESGHTSALSPQQQQQQRDQYILSLKRHQDHFPAPSLLQRAYLNGILHKPKDIAFLARMAWRTIYSMVRLHCVELPFLIVTRFKYSTKHHPLGWPWWWTIVIALIRGVGVELRTIGHLRFVGHFMEGFLPLQMIFMRHVKVQKNVQFKVRLEALTRPERATLTHVREELTRRGVSVDIMNPSKEYLRSMHYPVHGPHAQISNMPDEVGRLEEGGIYSLKGEWIEALHHANDPRPRSTTVVLYFHGGGHGFLSPKSHRDYLARFAKEIGPGTRIFSLDYRMGPEHPFPAAIHDAFAAYLYLVQPKHEALILNKSEAQHLPVDPRDVVVGGDSAGANLAAAFMIYLAKYVQPSTSPKYIMPHATLLLSVRSSFFIFASQ